MKKGLLIVAVILVVFILGGLVSTYKHNNSEPNISNKTGNESICDTYGTRAEAMECINKQIISSRNLYTCGTIRYGQRECEETIANEMVKAQAKEFCDLLLKDSNKSNCATCNIDNYSLVWQFDQSPEMWTVEYTLARNQYLNETKMVFVNVSIPVIYGQNTRNGHKLISFEVLENGSISNKEFPSQNCI